MSGISNIGMHNLSPGMVTTDLLMSGQSSTSYICCARPGMLTCISTQDTQSSANSHALLGPSTRTKPLPSLARPAHVQGTSTPSLLQIWNIKQLRGALVHCMPAFKCMLQWLHNMWETGRLTTCEYEPMLSSGAYMCCSIAQVGLVHVSAKVV